jgi:hypothetical protein
MEADHDQQLQRIGRKKTGDAGGAPSIRRLGREA